MDFEFGVNGLGVITRVLMTFSYEASIIQYVFDQFLFLQTQKNLSFKGHTVIVEKHGRIIEVAVISECSYGFA